MDQPIATTFQVEHMIEIHEITNEANNPIPTATTTTTNHQPPTIRINPLNSIPFIFVEFLLTLTQIIASISVLLLSRHEHAPLLFIWIIGYISGCSAFILLLIYRFHIARNQNQPAFTNATPDQPIIARLVEQYFNVAVYGLFGVWFAFGCVLILGADSSVATNAPNLYRLSIAHLIFSSIGYLMPLLLCVSWCCCFPCLIALQDLSEVRGATKRTISSLPTYKFEENEAGGGVLAAGTENQRIISQEDAVCSICLESYENSINLKPLPCNHLFHKDCVDQWLKRNASCPLCKAKTGKAVSLLCWICGG